ncbi:MAG: hypothetical protein IT329_22730 [Caldilineaceae bacterium]|nr:hypothetical protein [Caldilineaceae bacterium]
MQPDTITFNRFTLAALISYAHYNTPAWRKAYFTALRAQRRRNPFSRYALTDPLLLQSLPRLIDLALEQDCIANPPRAKGFAVLSTCPPRPLKTPNRLWYIGWVAENLRAGR